MTSEPDKIDELVDELDDLKTTVEELEENPPQSVHRHTVRKLKDALDEASGIADDLEDEQDRSEK